MKRSAKRRQAILGFVFNLKLSNKTNGKARWKNVTGEQDLKTVPPLAVDRIGSFHVGGRMIRLDDLPLRERVSTPGGPPHRVDPNGEIFIGQMYVQYVRLATPRAACPLLLWHGGGMSGASWESTPDGRPGWQTFFLRAGFDTYVSDAVERGRASFAPFPQIYPEAPYFRTARELWEDTFRFGPAGSWRPDPALRRHYPGLRFPVDAFEAFLSQCVPRWSCNDRSSRRPTMRSCDASILASSFSPTAKAAISASPRRSMRRNGCAR